MEFLIEAKYIPTSSIWDYSLTESVYYCYQENYVFMSVYNKHVKLSLWVSHFYRNITTTINPPIESILTITELIYLNSLQLNKHLHKVTCYQIGRSSKNRTLTKSFGDSCTTIILNSYNKTENQTCPILLSVVLRHTPQLILFILTLKWVGYTM